MVVPVVLKGGTVLIYHAEKKVMQEPEMVGVAGIKLMAAFQSSKECPPSERKLGSNLDPHTLNASVSR